MIRLEKLEKEYVTLTMDYNAVTNLTNALYALGKSNSKYKAKIVIMFFACFFSNLWGRASQRMGIENVDVVRIHTNFRETNHYSYCPYCGKELIHENRN